MNLYDYGARLYDPAIGRWFVVDPMAERAPDWTPYRYGFNNPMKYTDPTGMFEYVKGGYGENIEVGQTFSHSQDGGYRSDKISGEDEHGKAVWVGMNYTVNKDGKRNSRIHRYVEYEDGSTRNISSSGGIRSRAGRSNKSNGGSYLEGASLALYLTSTSLAVNEVKDTYNLINAYQNSPRSMLQNAFPGYFKGSSKAVQNSQKALNVTKAVGRSLSRPFFFASVGISAVNVASDPTFNNIAWNAADVSVGAAGLIFAASPFGWAVGTGAAIYFTGRMAYDIYDAYNDEN